MNQTSAWWMGATDSIVGNALLAVPDPNVSIMRKCTVFPVESVVRGFMTGAAWFKTNARVHLRLNVCKPGCFDCGRFRLAAGSTETSLWTHYAAGEREYCGNAFPDGMCKNDRLAQNVVSTLEPCGLKTCCPHHKAVCDTWSSPNAHTITQQMIGSPCQVTPTTKAADHDEPISAAEIVERGLMSAEDWDAVRGWLLLRPDSLPHRELQLNGSPCAATT